MFPNRRVPEGTNEIYLYLQVGRANDPRGSGIGGLYVAPIIYTPARGKEPAGVLRFLPEDFILGT